jgi:hypothetical protein
MTIGKGKGNVVCEPEKVEGEGTKENEKESGKECGKEQNEGKPRAMREDERRTSTESKKPEKKKEEKSEEKRIPEETTITHDSKIIEEAENLKKTHKPQYDKVPEREKEKGK